MHPRIAELVTQVKQKGFEDPNIAMLIFLGSINVTQTEAIVMLHQGFDMDFTVAEKLVATNHDIFLAESFEDAAFETFLYMNYDADNLKFKYDHDKVEFPMKKPSSDSSG